MKTVVGYTAGVYDMFHIGHLNILKRAKEQCDYLIVGISTDELVRKDKNKTPVIPYEERAAIVEAIKYVDEVVPQPDKNKMAAWEKYHFIKCLQDLIGKEHHQWKKFEAEFALINVEIVYLPHTDGISSTQLTMVLKIYQRKYQRKSKKLELDNEETFLVERTNYILFCQYFTVIQ